MRAEGQTSIHLLLAGIVSVYSTILVLVTMAMGWELWMIPLIVIGVGSVWCIHIGQLCSGIVYENLCAGLMMVGFFFFAIHKGSLYDIPAVACMMILIFSMFDRKRLLYMTAVLYILALLYHFLFLHTIGDNMGNEEFIRLLLGIAVMAGSAGIARYRINRRNVNRKQYDAAFTQLETAGRQNAIFLSNVSHELRTPINMVIGISEVALEKAVSPEVRDDIRSIQRAGKRMASQINNMIDYTEIVEGTLTPTREHYRITSVLNDVLTMMAMQSSQEHLELVFDINPKIPSLLIGDPEKISHVLKILLENSIKFTEEGGINVCIEFRREAYGINLMIDIFDTGIGMTESQLAQMYDDFYQADSGSSRYAGGLGLGIPIARGLLYSMGGFIHFKSEGQQGLEAHITIPQEVADNSPAIVLSNAEKLCIACYFRPERYHSDDVRRYYDKLILHLVEGLGIEGYQAHNFEGLVELQRTYQLTHVFIAQSEYEENRSYYEGLAYTLRVIVIAEKDYVLTRGSRLFVIHKPFSVLSVANLLNGDMKENGFKEAQIVGRRPFVCVGIRALAVDDEEMNLVVAKGVLGSYGIQVDTCLSGRGAVEWCSRISYDVIFLDHMMPGFDGVQTLRRIREMNNGAYRDLPIIALTANTISGAREMFKSEGFTDFIPKPIERAVLERVLHKVLPKSCIRYSTENEIEDLSMEAGGKAAPKEGIKDASAADSAKASEIAASSIADGTDTDSVFAQETEGDVPAGESSLPYERLVQAGINVDMGLDYCYGEEEFYLEMLRMFFSGRDEKKEELIQLYEAANWEDYAIKVHALKSTSLTIGAEELSERARLLEQAGKKEDAEYIHENHSPLLRMYDEVCESIEGL